MACKLCDRFSATRGTAPRKRSGDICMAARGRTAQRMCYVYLLSDGPTPIYIGKGTSKRAQASRRKHGGDISYLETGLSDDAAFEREKFWIAEMQPQNNKCPGGNGGRSTPRKAPRRSKVEIEIDRVGSRKYCAQFLISRLNEANCEKYGVSKVDLSRLREVAHG